MGLVETYRGVVYPWHCDHMGHMNVMHYVGKFDEATWHFFAQIGLTNRYFEERDRGMVAVEQNLKYLREFRAGDLVEIWSEIEEVTRKGVRFIHRMNNSDGDVLSAECRLTGTHIDRTTRKSTPFDDDMLANIKTVLAG